METIKTVLGNLDDGFFAAAKSRDEGPRSTYGYLSDLMREAGCAPTQEDIDRRVAKMAAKAGYRPNDILPEPLHAALEQFAADTWGLELAFAEMGIRVKSTPGNPAATLAKLYATSSSTILFPPYIEQQIMAGILATSILPDLIASETNIDSGSYQSLYMAESAANRQTSEVAEGAEIPTTTLSTSEHTVTLAKYGRRLDVTFEVLRRQALDVIGVFFQRVGAQLAIDETDDAIETLLAGDGNSNAVTDTDAETTGTLDYDELVRLFLAFTDGYQMTSAVVNSTNLRTILNMSEFKDPMSGFTFQRTGVLPGPMGANWHRWDSTGSSTFSTDRILAVDRRYALLQVTEQGATVEAENIIRQQIQGTQVTKWTGFAKMLAGATQCLDITT